MVSTICLQKCSDSQISWEIELICFRTDIVFEMDRIGLSDNAVAGNDDDTEDDCGPVAVDDDFKYMSVLVRVFSRCDIVVYTKILSRILYGNFSEFVIVGVKNISTELLFEVVDGVFRYQCINE